MNAPWAPTSWKQKLRAQPIPYEDTRQVDRMVEKIGKLPPLVNSWEIERLKEELSEAQIGKRFVLQGGDCAEMLADCDPTIIANKLKILLQMSLVIVHAAHRPLIRIGRLAGQYAKPRSSPTETREGVTLPSYFGDLVNGQAFTADARRPNPEAMLTAYHHAAMTLNFIRSLTAAGFADVHHPEYWNLDFMRRAAVPVSLRTEYEQTTKRLTDAMRFMESVGEGQATQLTRVDFYTSHEGLHLDYEHAQTTQVPRRTGHYDLSTHFPWIGERTRALDGAHVEFFRGIENPVGVKVGPNASPSDIVALVERLNPNNSPGKVALITRLGSARVRETLPPLVTAVTQSRQRVLWMTDPMHGNGVTTTRGIKTRRFDDIVREIEQSFDVHEEFGTSLGGIHFELTGEDVTECVGGAADVREEDLDANYKTGCDPRLNYGQAMEMSFRVARKMSADVHAAKPALKHVSTRPDANRW